MQGALLSLSGDGPWRTRGQGTVLWTCKKLFQKGNISAWHCLALFHKVLLTKKGSVNSPGNPPKCRMVLKHNLNMVPFHKVGSIAQFFSFFLQISLQRRRKKTHHSFKLISNLKYVWLQILNHLRSFNVPEHIISWSLIAPFWDYYLDCGDFHSVRPLPPASNQGPLLVWAAIGPTCAPVTPSTPRPRLAISRT